MILLTRIVIKNGKTLHLKVKKTYRDSETLNKRIKKLQDKYELGAVHTEHADDSLEVEIKKLKKEIEKYKYSILIEDVCKFSFLDLLGLKRIAKKKKK